ncbi:MarR family transcriptional regulator [Herbaspirillum sp. HC18]|nr:MarR family transcriptional regulator [Herbaspirillum sp. HC18]
MPNESNSDIDLGSLPTLVGYHLRMAQVTVFKDFDRELGELEITPAIFGVLEVLQHNKGLTQSRLAAAIGLDRSSLVPLLDKLEKRNLVAREASQTDRRSNHLFLTPEGKQLLVKADKRIKQHEQRIVAGLTKTETKQLISLLSKIGQPEA